MVTGGCVDVCVSGQHDGDQEAAWGRGVMGHVHADLQRVQLVVSLRRGVDGWARSVALVEANARAAELED
eukprot:314453-Rhodomonas_salina.2